MYIHVVLLQVTLHGLSTVLIELSQQDALYNGTAGACCKLMQHPYSTTYDLYIIDSLLYVACNAKYSIVYRI
jgi:hypothetical protein